MVLNVENTSRNYSVSACMTFTVVLLGGANSNQSLELMSVPHCINVCSREKEKSIEGL